jgi:hypothetical protein
LLLTIFCLVEEIEVLTEVETVYEELDVLCDGLRIFCFGLTVSQVGLSVFSIQVNMVRVSTELTTRLATFRGRPIRSAPIVVNLTWLHRKIVNIS